MGRHKEWRKIAKKLRRKRIRTLSAKRRDEQIAQEEERLANSPSHQAWLAEQKAIELFAQEEEEKLREQRHKEWLEKDRQDHEAWLLQQQRLAEIKLKKAKQQLLIQEEWERELKKNKEIEENKKRVQAEKAKLQEKLLSDIDDYITGNIQNLPTEINVTTETQPGKEICPFYTKTGACRFREECSRNHIRPGISSVLLFVGFYSHFSMSHRDEHDTDISLEYESSETYQHFLEFFDDIYPEFEKCGKVAEIKVCCNREPHLRGNVYVEYARQRDAVRAFRAFQGRWYAGKQINPQFTSIPSWRHAVCGLFRTGKCPKGSSCNFLHVFRNPRMRRSPDLIHKSHHHDSDKDNWRWSESPERTRRSKSRERSGNRSKNRSRDRSKDRSSRERPRKRVKSKDIKSEKQKKKDSSINSDTNDESERKRRKENEGRKSKKSKRSKEKTRRKSQEDSLTETFDHPS